VNVAVHPWQLELCDPSASTLTDTVVHVTHDRGGLRIRLMRFTVEVRSGDNGHPPVTEGSIVGLRVSPQHVHIVPASRP
jgi:hypothetical protein